MLTDRVTICGDSSTGKTCIFRLLKGSGLPEFSRSTRISSHFQMKAPMPDNSGTTFNINIWDTGGDPLMRHLVEIYITNIDIAVLVIDLSNESTLDSVELWLETIRMASPRAKILIVGNKSDIKNITDETINDKMAGKKVTYMEMSAKDENRNGLDELRTKLVEISIDNRKKQTAAICKKRSKTSINGEKPQRRKTACLIQ